MSVWLNRLKDFGYATYSEMLTVWNLSLKEKRSNAKVKKKTPRQKHTNIITDDGCTWKFSLFFNICFSFTKLILHITTFMFSAAASDLKDQMQIRLAHRKEGCTMSPYFSEPCQAQSQSFLCWASGSSFAWLNHHGNLIHNPIRSRFKVD